MSNDVFLTNTITFHKNAGFKALVKIQKIFFTTKFTIFNAKEIDQVSVMCEYAEDRLYNATIKETIECILITINSKRRDFSFAKY